jgi:magnesium chelatase family protein
MAHGQIRKHCALDAELGDLLQDAMEKLKLSARAYDRILKVSRTIAVGISGSSQKRALHQHPG